MVGRLNLLLIGFVILLSCLFSGCFIAHYHEPMLSDELNIFNWEDYFGETTLEDFEEIFGVKINLYTFEDEDYMISALSTNPSKYDIVIASDSTVKELIEMKQLAKLDKSHIPNIKNLDPDFLNLSFDPGNEYSIPYLWGTTGIAYNRSAVKENVKSWSILWDNNSCCIKISWLFYKYKEPLSVEGSRGTTFKAKTIDTGICRSYNNYR